jgi:hypothetical protein
MGRARRPRDLLAYRYISTASNFFLSVQPGLRFSLSAATGLPSRCLAEETVGGAIYRWASDIVLLGRRQTCAPEYGKSLRESRRLAMHLLLVTGFLGSGKTTLIIPLAKSVVQLKRRVAILVNEIGEIGIDNQLMRQLDLNVWELLAGCICCTLSGDLVTTLQKLDADYAPDLVIVEPSGAHPGRNVLTAAVSRQLLVCAPPPSSILCACRC